MKFIMILKIVGRVYHLTGVLRGRIVNYICPNVHIGRNTFIGKSVKFHTFQKGQIIIGEDCFIQDFVQMRTYGGNIIIGDNSTVNSFCSLYGQGGLTIGKYVRIASGTCIVSSNHTFNDKVKPIALQPLKNIGILIKDNVWIGCNVAILDGVVIGSGAVIGAGSVVTKKVSDYTVNAGVPAKMKKEY